jgi:signal transduction histidine kinase
MLRSLRTRLAVLFAGTLVLATVIAGAASIRLYQSYNRDQVKMELRSQVGSIAEYYGQALEQTNGGGGPAQGPDQGSVTTPANSKQIAKISGSRVYFVGDPESSLFPQLPNIVQNAGVKPPFDWHTLGKDARPSFQFKPKGDRKNRTFVGVAAPVRFGDTDFTVGAVVLAKPLADINNAWKNVIGRVAVGTALGVFVAFLLAAFFSRRITRPLRRIGAAADRVAQGDLEVNVVGPNTGDDELGQLAKRFQGMVDRLREVDELERNFLMRVTHELRTPVTAISGHVQALNEGLVEPDELDASLAAVSEEVRRIGRLVDDLLDLTRLEAHQFRLVREEVGLESLLDQAATSFREKARVNDVQFDALTTGAPTVLSDGDRVLQVVTNLLDNAFRWTPRDGTVTLSYSAVNGNAAIHVSDTGPGIPKNDQDAVFHPFYSRRGEGGTGLGLSIGRELAHALGGRLTVESEVGHGTTFTLSLPTGPGR